MKKRTRLDILLDFGDKAYEEENFEEALIYYRKAYKQKPEESFIAFNAGLASNSLDDNSGAIGWYTKAIESEEGYALAYYARANCYRYESKYEEALLDYQKALELDPENPKMEDLSELISEMEALSADTDRCLIKTAEDTETEEFRDLVKLGKEAAYTGKHKKAVKYYKKAHKINPHNKEVLLDIILTDYGTYPSDYKEAIEFASEGHNLFPQDPEFAFHAGIASTKLKDIPGAIDWFSKAIAIDDNYAEAYNKRGICYYDNEEYESALHDFQKAFELKPGISDLRKHRDECSEIISITKCPEELRKLMELGQKVFTEGNYQEAITYYTEAIKFDDNYALPCLKRADCYYNEKDYKAALNDYMKAWRLGKKDIVKKIDMSIHYSGADKDPEAFGLSFEELMQISTEARFILFAAEKIKPEDKSLIKYSWQASYKNLSYGIRDEFIALPEKYALKGISLYPEDWIFHFYAGMTYHEMKRYAEAILHYTNAINLNPPEPEPYLNRAFCYRFTGNFQGAMKDFKKCEELEIEISELDYNLAVCLELTGKFEQAIDLYENLYETEPSDFFKKRIAICRYRLGGSESGSALKELEKLQAEYQEDLELSLFIQLVQQQRREIRGIRLKEEWLDENRVLKDRIMRCPDCGSLIIQSRVEEENLCYITSTTGWARSDYEEDISREPYDANEKIKFYSNIAKYRTDGFRRGSCDDFPPAAIKCNVCGRWLILTEAEPILEPPFIRNLKYGFLYKIPYVDNQNTEDCIEALNSPDCASIEFELRLRLMWKQNDNPRTPFSEKEENLKKLLALEIPADSEDPALKELNPLLLRAEIYRELGEFDKALEILSNSEADTDLMVAEPGKTIKLYCDNKDSSPAWNGRSPDFEKLMNEGKYSDAAEINPYDRELMIITAKEKYRNETTADALKYMNEATSVFPDEPRIAFVEDMASDLDKIIEEQDRQEMNPFAFPNGPTPWYKIPLFNDKARPFCFPGRGKELPAWQYYQLGLCNVYTREWEQAIQNLKTAKSKGAEFRDIDTLIRISEQRRK